MKFNYIKFKNFLSFGDYLCVIDLSEPGLTLITGDNQKDGGSNGSGKSTAIVDSITYALFGKTTKKLKAEGAVSEWAVAWGQAWSDDPVCSGGARRVVDGQPCGPP